ncbi:MAG: glycosyltransferase [Acidimicrobiales bacterium]|nr:glycosyltransferase [Acidimicrobiales bacterium]
MTAPPAVSIVVPTRDRPASLRHCLVALDAQTAPSFEIVVVDDASTDAAAVAAAVGEVGCARLVLGEGRGPAAARNAGARAATAPVICFTDDDCRPGPEWAATMAERVDDGAVAVAGPTRNARPADAFATAAQTVTNHLTDESLDPVTGHVGFAPTSNLAMTAALHRALPFDESFPLAAGEDRDWCDRLTASGETIAFAPGAIVDHHQDLDLRRFWRQQERYGRGSQHLRGHRDDAGLQSPRFYVGLVRTGFRHGMAPGALVVVAQVATAVGVVREIRAQRRA